MAPEQSANLKAPALYVVVCLSLHVALGPFTDLQRAVACAREETGKGGCSYWPIPLQLMEGTVTAAPDAGDSGEQEWHRPGVYL